LERYFISKHVRMSIRTGRYKEYEQMKTQRRESVSIFH